MYKEPQYVYHDEKNKKYFGRWNGSANDIQFALDAKTMDTTGAKNAVAGDGRAEPLPTKPPVKVIEQTPIMNGEKTSGDISGAAGASVTAVLPAKIPVFTGPFTGEDTSTKDTKEQQPKTSVGNAKLPVFTGPFTGGDAITATNGTSSGDHHATPNKSMGEPGQDSKDKHHNKDHKEKDKGKDKDKKHEKKLDSKHHGGSSDSPKKDNISTLIDIILDVEV